jgi:hypothetical protein
MHGDAGGPFSPTLPSAGAGSHSAGGLRAIESFFSAELGHHPPAALLTYLEPLAARALAATEAAEDSHTAIAAAAALQMEACASLLLTAPPAVGKQRHARALGKLYHHLGLLPSGHVVECSAADLKVGFVGASEALVKHLVQRAEGGVLYLDEVSLLLCSEGKPAIDALLSCLPAAKKNTMLVLGDSGACAATLGALFAAVDSNFRPPHSFPVG